MTHTTHDIGVASQIGKYSDAIEVRSNMRWLITSGTPGISAAGKLPDDFVGQAELAWQNVANMLAKADMTAANIVKVTQYLTRADDIKAYAGIRTRFIYPRSHAGCYAPRGSPTRLAQNAHRGRDHRRQNGVKLESPARLSVGISRPGPVKP